MPTPLSLYPPMLGGRACPPSFPFRRWRNSPHLFFLPSEGRCSRGALGWINDTSSIFCAAFGCATVPHARFSPRPFAVGWKVFFNRDVPRLLESGQLCLSCSPSTFRGSSASFRATLLVKAPRSCCPGSPSSPLTFFGFSQFCLVVFLLVLFPFFRAPTPVIGCKLRLDHWKCFFFLGLFFFYREHFYFIFLSRRPLTFKLYMFLIPFFSGFSLTAVTFFEFFDRRLTKRRTSPFATSQVHLRSQTRAHLDVAATFEKNPSPVSFNMRPSCFRWFQAAEPGVSVD